MSGILEALAPLNDQQQAPAAPDAPAAPIVNANEPPAPDAPTPPVPENNSQSQPTNTAPPAAPQTIDYNKYLHEMSGGVIKDVDGFKAVLPRLAEYDTLKSENERLAAEMAQAPKLADDEVRIFNELKASGASKEQIKQFHKINEYGTIGEMPDRDARIAKMVMVDGVKPSVAEMKVDREFKLKDEDISPEEREILDDDLRVAARADKQALEAFKSKVSAPANVPAEEVQLQQQAQLLAHQNKVKPYVKDVMTSIPNLGTFNLAYGKEGEANHIAVAYEVPIDEAIRTKLGQYVENYFIDALTPVTPENTLLALNYARAEYFREHSGELLQNAFEKGVSLTTEKLVNKYENRSGLKPDTDNPILPGKSDAAATAKFFSDKVNRVNQ